MQAGVNEVDGVLVAGRPVKLGGELHRERPAARRRARRGVARPDHRGLQPRGGFSAPGAGRLVRRDPRHCSRPTSPNAARIKE